MVAFGAESIVNAFNLSDTLFGMTLVAFAISFEEMVREAVPAGKGHPDVSMGNIVGSILYFFTFNAGLISITAPITVTERILTLYYPYMLATVLVVGLLASRRRIGRLEGSFMVGFYALFIVLSYLLEGRVLFGL